VIVVEGIVILGTSPHLEKVAVLWLFAVVAVSFEGSVAMPDEKIMNVVDLGAEVEALVVDVS
jgi:hypothetical protein